SAEPATVSSTSSTEVASASASVRPWIRRKRDRRAPSLAASAASSRSTNPPPRRWGGTLVVRADASQRVRGPRQRAVRSDRDRLRSLREQLPDPGDHRGAVQLDRAHRAIVRQRSVAVLEVEPVEAEG